MSRPGSSVLYPCTTGPGEFLHLEGRRCTRVLHGTVRWTIDHAWSRRWYIVPAGEISDWFTPIFRCPMWLKEVFYRVSYLHQPSRFRTNLYFSESFGGGGGVLTFCPHLRDWIISPRILERIRLQVLSYGCNLGISPIYSLNTEGYFHMLIVLHPFDCGTVKRFGRQKT